ncbi:MAG: DUF6165 family protein, partial [Candidatus Babeliales bacterium]|nr:DUF6165 family protein [Candidatus Babeliales bacterium]
LKKAIAINPNHEQTYFNIGLIYLTQEDHTQAASYFQQAIEHKIDYIKAYSYLGQAYQKLERFDDALNCYNKMNQYAPPSAELHINMARLYKATHKPDQELNSYKQALALEPHNIIALFDISYLYTNSGNYQAAIPYYEKLLSVDPTIIDAECNFAHTLKYLGHYERAYDHYQKVVKAMPNFAHGYYGLAECALALGDFEHGWPAFEWRWKRSPNDRNFSKKLWDGSSSLVGKTVMLRAEYGQGDTMQFIRYAKLLKQQGATVILEAQTTLITLLSQCSYLDAVVPVVDSVDQLPYFDFQIPVMSLPYYFKTTADTVPTDIPYLKANQKLIEHWKQELKNDTNFKVGICWGTSPYYEQFKSALSKKAINLESFLPLSQIRGVSLYSLQKMDGVDQLNALPQGMIVHDFGSEFDYTHGRFMDTAAVIENLDLIVTVDTSVAHLAGALGKPVWILLPTVADWRWMINRNDTPWYPNMQLFRQTITGDWDSLLNEVSRKIETLLVEREIASIGLNPVSIMAEVQVGELIDKITILQIKMKRIKDPAKLVNIKAELDTLLATCNREVHQTTTLKSLWNELLEVNTSLWLIEDDIRDKERAREFGDSFVKLARAVYYTNDERCRIKRELNLLTGSRLIEEKSYTDYTIPTTA